MDELSQLFRVTDRLEERVRQLDDAVATHSDDIKTLDLRANALERDTRTHAEVDRLMFEQTQTTAKQIGIDVAAMAGKVDRMALRIATIVGGIAVIAFVVEHFIAK